MAPDDVVGQAAPTEVPNSTMAGVGKFEGPVWKLPVDGIEIGYRQFGHGPDLIMVPGDTAPMSLWLPYLLHPLAAHFRVTIFDNRGVGYSSDDLSRPLTVPLMARDTSGLIEVVPNRGAVVRVPSPWEVRDAYERLQSIEGDADKLMNELLRELYQGDVDARMVVFWKDIYELLEKGIDRCRDAGYVVFHVTLKYS